MRNGYILLHRKGLTRDEWKHPERTLAWIDLCTMAAWEEYTDTDGVLIRRGEVIASYGFLAERWRVSKSTAHAWITTWIAERQLERRSERSPERNAERFFLVNYAKYQDIAERVAERPAERQSERTPELMKVKEEIKTSESKQGNGDVAPDVVDPLEDEFRRFLPFASKVLGQPKAFTPSALSKWRARRLKWSPRELAEAFANLSNEPDRWKITNNGHRPLAWWLHSDDRIEEMRSCHLKGAVSNPIPHA